MMRLYSSRLQLSDGARLAVAGTDEIAFLQLQSRRGERLNLETINGIDVHYPFDQNRPLGRTVLQLASRFPRSFQLAANLVKKVVTG